MRIAVEMIEGLTGVMGWGDLHPLVFRLDFQEI